MSNNYLIDVKKKRQLFIRSFENNLDSIYDEIIKGKDDNQLYSIRVHKYLTDSGLFGKVKIARFFDEIGLNEKTKFKDLNTNNIKKITEYVSNT